MMILFLYEYAHYPVDYIIDNDLDSATKTVIVFVICKSL